MGLSKIFHKLYLNPLVAALFHTTPYLLKQELAGYDSVLDLGCGPRSPLGSVKLPYSIGVEIFDDYIRRSKEERVHNQYVKADICNFECKAKSVDAIVMIGVLEHLHKQDGYRLLKKAETIARKKVIVTCPNGFLLQGSHDANSYQIHHSGWLPSDFHALHFAVRGLSGPKVLRKENESGTSLSDESESPLLSTVRFSPKWFWFVISAILQIVTYHLPSISFELFAMKDIEMKESQSQRSDQTKEKAQLH